MSNKRYKVIDRSTGLELRDFVVLVPERDYAARIACAAYAEATSNYEFAMMIKNMLERIHYQRLDASKRRKHGTGADIKN